MQNELFKETYIIKHKPGPGELKRARKKKKLSLRQAAEKAGICHTYLWHMEQGRVPHVSERIVNKLTKLYSKERD